MLDTIIALAAAAYIGSHAVPEDEYDENYWESLIPDDYEYDEQDEWEDDGGW